MSTEQINEGKIDRIIGWFIHPTLTKDPERHIRARQMLMFMSFSCPFFFYNIYKWADLGVNGLAWSMAGVFFVVFVMAFVFRKTGSITVPGNAMLGALTAHFVYLLYITGGFNSSAMTWLVVIPLISSLYFSNRICMFWTTVLIVIVGIFGVLRLKGYPLPELMLPERAQTITHISNVMGPILAVFFCSWFFNDGMSSAFNGQRISMKAQQENLDRLRKIHGNVSETTETITGTSMNLNRTADELASKAGEIKEMSANASKETGMTAADITGMAEAADVASQRVVNVASSSATLSDNMKSIGRETEKVSDHLNMVADAAEEMSIGVGMIATAIEEMYASLNEVAKNSARGANVTRDASRKADETFSTINTLGADAEEIGDVIDLIKGIASQTHILALNATIEAVGAGESGKGFRVVANEVKDLARQTTGATENIRKKILNMQANTKTAIGAIEDIVKVTTEINLIMGNIASAVEEQTATTNEISKNLSGTVTAADQVSKNVQKAAQSIRVTAGNIQEAVKSGQDVSDNLGELAETTVKIAQDAAIASERTRKVSENVTGVSGSIQTTLKGADSIRILAENLTRLAARLQQSVG